MELYAYCQGHAHRIYFLEVHENRDVKAFLEDLHRARKRDFVAIVRRMDVTCKSGLLWNDNHTRRLRYDAKPTCEFKAGQARILWFVDKFDQQIIVCTNAFKKKSDDTPQGDINRAHSRMELYYEHRKTLLAR